MTHNIKKIIAKELSKSRYVELKEEDITFQMFKNFAISYLKKYGYIPENWKKELEKAKS